MYINLVIYQAVKQNIYEIIIMLWLVVYWYYIGFHLGTLHLQFFLSLSNVHEKDCEGFLYISVWDWDRIGTNDYIGAMALKVNDILKETGEGKKVESWYKLLNHTNGRKRHERIISDEEAEQVGTEFQNIYFFMSQWSFGQQYVIIVD